MQTKISTILVQSLLLVFAKWQAAVPNFLTERLTGLTFWPLNGVMSHLCTGLPCCQISASYTLPLSS